MSNSSSKLLQNQEQCRKTLENVSNILNSVTASLSEQVAQCLSLDSTSKLFSIGIESKDKIIASISDFPFFGFFYFFQVLRAETSEANFTIVSEALIKAERELLQERNLKAVLLANNTGLLRQLKIINQRLVIALRDKKALKGQLGTIKHDVDGLKSNTSRLEGEKRGLQEVLKVKTKLEEEKIEEAKKVIDLATFTGIMSQEGDKNRAGTKVLENIINKGMNGGNGILTPANYGSSAVIDTEASSVSKGLTPHQIAKFAKILPNLIKA